MSGEGASPVTSKNTEPLIANRMNLRKAMSWSGISAPYFVSNLTFGGNPGTTQTLEREDWHRYESTSDSATIEGTDTVAKTTMSTMTRMATVLLRLVISSW